MEGKNGRISNHQYFRRPMLWLHLYRNVAFDGQAPGFNWIYFKSFSLLEHLGSFLGQHFQNNLFGDLFDNIPSKSLSSSAALDSRLHTESHSPGNSSSLDNEQEKPPPTQVWGVKLRGLGHLWSQRNAEGNLLQHLGTNRGIPILMGSTVGLLGNMGSFGSVGSLVGKRMKAW